MSEASPHPVAGAGQGVVDWGRCGVLRQTSFVWTGPWCGESTGRSVFWG